MLPQNRFQFQEYFNILNFLKVLSEFCDKKESYCPLKIIFLHKNKESHFHRASYKPGHLQKHSWLREHTLA